MLLAHLTAPLMGLVDTAVLGHMQGSHYLAGASFAALVLTQIYWICGFIRMSATGLSAQARGQQSTEAASRVLYQSLFSAVVIGAAILALGPLILYVSFVFTDANDAVSKVIEDYFYVRLWGAPAALANLALIGWMLGQQQARAVMAIQITGNLLNIGLNLLFVYVFDWDVKGVAGASVFVEYFIAFASLTYIFKGGIRHLQFSWLGLKSLSVISKLNSAMLGRNLALQACLVFMTFQGLRLGEQTAAINAILMQFFVLISLGLDAVAYGVEAKIGEAKGAKSPRELKSNALIGLFWSNGFALVYTLLFIFFGVTIIHLLTDLESLREASYQFLPMVYALPLVGHWCFLMDGVFVGLTRAKAMRNSMVLGALLVFFPVWWFLQEHGNWALWLALLALLAFRGVSLSAYFVYLARQHRLID
ncbi:MATE family efflux transporter [Aliiglaciecola litoralis]